LIELIIIIRLLKSCQTQLKQNANVKCRKYNISLGSVATHLGCDGIFSDSADKFFPDSDSEVIFGKVKAYKNGADFSGHPVHLLL